MMDLRSINARFFCIGLALNSKTCKNNHNYWNALLDIIRINQTYWLKSTIVINCREGMR